jgi:hypothetical protein
VPLRALSPLPVFYRARRMANEHKRRHVADEIVALRHRFRGRRRSHLIAEGEWACAINLIQVQVPRFCSLTLRDAVVA